MNALLHPGTGLVRSESGPDHLEMRFDVVGEHLATARRVIREFLGWWGVGEEAADRLVIAVNELLTNILRHTNPDGDGCRVARLSLHHVPEGVAVILTDREPALPLSVVAKPDAESGRGWDLVRALVDAHSVTPTGLGKDIYLYVSDPVGTAPGLRGSSCRGAA